MTSEERQRMFRRVFRLPDNEARAREALDEELRFHLEGRIEELEASGLPHAAAEAEAHRRFGDFEAHRLEALAIDTLTLRGRRHMDLLDTLSRELRHAARALARSRSFTATAVLTLGVGLGATTAIFTMLDAVVLRPLPYPDADRLVELSSPVPKLKGDTLWRLARHEMYYFKTNSRSLEDIGVYSSTQVIIGASSGDRPAQRAPAAVVSSSIFSVLGVVPERGRLLLAADSRERKPSVVVLGHGYWVQRFGGDPSIIGKSIELEGAQVTVVGVVPETAQLPDQRVDAWLPAYTYPEQPAMSNHTWSAIARLRPHATIEQARGELASLTARLPELFPDAEPADFMAETGFYTQVRRLRDVVVGEVMTRALWILFAAVLIVLLVSAANLSSLFLVRIDSRRRETALRSALGANRVNLAMQLLSESALISIAAALVAVVLGQAGLRVLLAVAPAELPRLTEVHLGAAGIAVTIAGAALVGLVLGLAPLLVSPELDISTLKDGTRGITLSAPRHALRAALVVSQVAMSLVLLTAAGLMVRTFQQLRAVSPGFNPVGVLTMNVAIPTEKYGRDYARTSALYEQMALAIHQLPGVTAVGYGEKLPLEGGNLCTGVTVEGGRTGREDDCPSVSMISPGYFEAMGIRVDGQALTWSGMNQHNGGAIVSRSYTNLRQWTERNAIGKGIKLSGDPFFRVSGVASDVLADGLDKPPVSLVYFPILPIPGAELEQVPTYMNLVVRTRSGDPLRLTPAIGRIISSAEPSAAVANARLMENVVARSMARRTFTMLMLGIAATMAIVLSVVGLYGVLSYVVEQRRGELAIRMALGAQKARVERMVLAQSLRLATLGIAVGAVVALASMRVLQSLLFGVSPTDPSLLVGAAAVLASVALAAGYVPARRAASIQPGEVLRGE